jgi:hypothetical protein
MTMTMGKSAAITAGFIGAFGVGVWTGPHLTHASVVDTNAPVAAIESPVATPAAPPAVVHPRAQAAVAPTTTAFAPIPTALEPTAPELHQRLKPLLRSGANMEIASEGFRSAEQFATVAHASQNMNVPFMLLKHRVLNEGDTLVAAIRKSKPEVDAVVEADRARAEARSDIASLD